MLVSLPLAQRLFDYDTHTATALRIQPGMSIQQTGGASVEKINKLKKELSKTLGPGYKVLDRYEQQEDFFRILHIEKWLTVLLLIFILLIASFNIIGSLSMLIIDKSEDSRILSHLGASDREIRRIFLLEGWLISSLGTLTGLVLGVLLCLGQQHFGWLKLGSGSEYVISAYPVLVQWTDIVMVALIVLALGFAAAWYPTRKFTLILASLFVLQACRNTEPTPRQDLPASYTTAYAKYHGHCYDSIQAAVVALDLYSTGLDLDSAQHMKGSGYNLYLSDIFVPDSLLEPGKYLSDHTGTAFTFLPGRDYEGYPYGTYILKIEEDKITSILLIDSGTFVHRNDSLLFTLYYQNAEGRTVTYQPCYQGELTPWPKP